MRQNGSVQVQDPSASPTFNLSRPAPNPDVPPALRRNLFGSQLSRRPTNAVPNASIDRMPDPFQSLSPPSQMGNRERERQIYQMPSQASHNGVSLHSLDIYDSRPSPARSLSPAKLQSHNLLSSSIIALDPATGRPQLPVMPRLPRRMREGSEEDEDDEDDIDGESEDEEQSWRQINSFDRPMTTQNDLELHSSSLVGMSSQHTRLHELIDTGTNGGDYRDYEKIEHILSEMQSQQRARARTAVPPEMSSSFLLETPTDIGISARTRGKAKAMTRSQLEQSKPRSSDARSRIGGVGACLNPADKDELLSLIMTSLSKRVQEADEDAWMFGDERNIADGFLSSASFNLAPRDDTAID